MCVFSTSVHMIWSFDGQVFLALCRLSFPITIQTSLKERDVYSKEPAFKKREFSCYFPSVMDRHSWVIFQINLTCCCIPFGQARISKFQMHEKPCVFFLLTFKTYQCLLHPFSSWIKFISQLKLLTLLFLSAVIPRLFQNQEIAISSGSEPRHFSFLKRNICQDTLNFSTDFYIQTFLNQVLKSLLII